MCQQLGIEIGESTVESSDSNNVKSEGSKTGAKSVASDQNVRKQKKSKKRASSTVHESSSKVGEKCTTKGVAKRKKQKIMSVTEGNVSKSIKSDTESESDEIAKPKLKVKRNIISSDTSSSSTSNGHADDSANKPVFIPGKCISFSCPECKFTAKSSGKVYSHMVDNHNVSKLVCEYCKFSTKNSTSMYNHTMKYCWKISGETRKQKKERKTKMKSPIHVQTAKGQSQKYKCNYCAFMAGSSGAVYKHMSDQHNMDKFLCTYCNFSTGNKTSMYNHKT